MQWKLFGTAERSNSGFEKSQEGVYIQIEDNGPGIPPLDQKKIFDPFFTKRNEGTGLGLSVSRKIAESYGGSIRLIQG